MNDREWKMIGNGLVFYSFGFVMYGMNAYAGVCAVMTVMILIHCFGMEKILDNWFVLFLAGILELILIERSGMSISASALFMVSIADLLHAFMWCRYRYRKHDYMIYLIGLCVCVGVTFCMESLPFGFLDTMLVIILVFVPYIFLGREKEREMNTVHKKAYRKKHVPVIE